MRTWGRPPRLLGRAIRRTDRRLVLAQRLVEIVGKRLGQVVERRTLSGLDIGFNGHARDQVDIAESLSSSSSNVSSAV